MRKLIIIVLVLIILGLYFYTDTTKMLLGNGSKIVGSTVANVGEKAVDKLGDTETVKEVKEKLTDAVSG